MAARARRATAGSRRPAPTSSRFSIPTTPTGRAASPRRSRPSRQTSGLVATLSSAVKHDRDGPRDAVIPAVKLAAPAFEWALICDLVPVEATSITVRRAAALAAGGFCERLRLTEDREFLIRLARHGGGELLPDLLWEKFSGDDNLSNDWAKAGQGLAAYVRERPEYAGRFRKVGSYLATKVLVADLRLGLWDAFRRDFRALLRRRPDRRRSRCASSATTGRSAATAGPCPGADGPREPDRATGGLAVSP